MKKLIPLDFHFVGLPTRYIYTDSRQIKATIIEDAKPFYMFKGSMNCIFGIAGRIFNYPNRIVSVRIILAIYYGKDKKDDKIEEIEEENEESVGGSDEKMA